MDNIRLSCPACGEVAGVPILWGFPTPEDVEKIESGEREVVFGGCVVPHPYVNVACRNCGTRWLDDDGLGVDEDP